VDATLLAGYKGSAAFLAAYSISIFFVLRAAGRFIGAWMLERFYWTKVLALFSGVILICFIAVLLRVSMRLFIFCRLPACSCPSFIPASIPKGLAVSRNRSMAPSRELFSSSPVFPRCGAAGHGGGQRCDGPPEVRIHSRTGFAALLFVGLLFNWIFDPTREL